LRWLKLKEILILICRCIFVAGLFLGLSRPQLKSKFFAPNRLASVYLILDNSWSMGYGKNFFRAVETAEKFINQYSPQSEFFVLPLCPDENLKEPFWTNRDNALKMIKEIKLSYDSGRLKEILRRFPPKNMRYPLEYLYIGDAQELIFEELAPLNVKKFFVVRIPNGTNIGIERVSLKDPFAPSTNYYQLVVNIRNFSPSPCRGTVNLQSGDFNIQKESDIPPAGSVGVELTVPAGIKKGVIHFIEDSLMADNLYFFSKSIPGRLKILLVGEINQYLISALKPSIRIFSPVEVSVANTIRQVDLRKFNVIILNGISDISENDAMKLSDFLAKRNTGIIFLPGETAGDNLRKLLKNYDIKIQKKVTPQGYATIKYLDFDYPPFNIFKEVSGFKNIKFFNFFEISTQVKIRARLIGDYPLIVNNKNLLVFATNFSEENTDIMFHPVFVPLIHRLIYGIINQNFDNEFWVGDVVDTTKIIIGPDGEYFRGEKFTRPGFYTISGETIAVNVASKEGNLKVISREAMSSLNIQLIDPIKGLARQDLSISFLILSLFMVVMEMILLLI